MPRSLIRHGTSLDTVTTPGFYMGNGLNAEDASPAANALLIVIATNNRVYQRIIEYNTNIEWTRQYWDNWKSWQRIPTYSEMEDLEARVSALENP